MRHRARKRIVAIVLPEIACELVRMAAMVHDGPFAVIVDDEPAPSDEPVKPTAILHAVDQKAWQYGARPGQKASQASAFVGNLQIVRLPRARVLEALGAVAELALAFGTTAGFDLRSDGERLNDASGLRTSAGAAMAMSVRYPTGAGAGTHDTVWLDVTGCSRLVGGDDLLCADLRERVAQLGHRARVAIADGPRIAQALARWSPTSETVVPAGKSVEHLAPLPVAALPLGVELLSWLGKLGILHVADLTRLDRKRLTPRLGRQARDLLALVSGQDDVPVVAYAQPRCIVEQASFDHELDGIEPLFFVVRGLTGRAVARLRARGEACSLASLTLTLDRAILRLVGRNRSDRSDDAQLAETQLDGARRDGARLDGAARAAVRAASGEDVVAATEQVLSLELPIPLASEGELLRALHAKLERLVLAAPVRGVRLTLDGLVPQRHHQLAMSDGDGAHRDPHALPTLLAELSAWLGSDRVGVLTIVDSHQPEERSKLVPCDPSSPGARTSAGEPPSLAPEPTRLLPEPIAITHGAVDTPWAPANPRPVLRAGGLVAAGRHLFILDRSRLSHRLDTVAWWSPEPLQRDYLRAWLHGSAGKASAPTEHVEASVFVARDETGQPRAFLHGWFD